MSIIFYHDAEQKKLAEQSLRETEKALGATIYTVIKPAGIFTEAEEYHQKYSLKNSTRLLQELKRFYPDENSLTHSAAAAKINGYIAGYGSREELQKEVDAFGLTTEGKDRLTAMVKPLEPSAGGTGKVGKFFNSVLSACGLVPKKN